MATWIIVRKSDLEIMGSYEADQKDESSNNRSYLLSAPICVHTELPEGLNASHVKCELIEDGVPQLENDDVKEAAIVEQAWTILRAKRDQLLAETDKYLLEDYPISAPNLQLMKDYRQELRDLPEEIEDPRDEVEWPEKPNV